MNVCILQSDPTLGGENLRILGHTIAGVPADLYVLPELFQIGFDPLADVFPDTAEIVPDDLPIKWSRNGFTADRQRR